MAYEQKDMTGTLFVNDKKESPQHPDFTGTVLINGVSLRLAAWKNIAKSGKKYLKISVSEDKPKFAKKQVDEYNELSKAGLASLSRQAPKPMPTGKRDDMDDSI